MVQFDESFEKSPHIPVLSNSILEFLAPGERKVRRIIDATIGFGGHSGLLLQNKPEAHLLGLDCDDEALSYSNRHLSFAKERCTLMHMKYSKMQDAAKSIGWDTVDTVLLDIGVSSFQLDEKKRGFSFRYSDSPLDMRMDQSCGKTAADILNHASQEELTQIFFEYGEIQEAKKLASQIVKTRQTTPFETCGQFAEICDKVLHDNKRKTHRDIPAPTLPFQAIRIAVNRELDELKKGLEAAVSLLAPGGRLAVITFHSLEDRIVKNFIREMALNCKCPPGLPICICSWRAKLKPVNKKPIEATPEEIRKNPRSACAKLRIAERLANSIL